MCAGAIGVDNVANSMLSALGIAAVPVSVIGFMVSLYSMTLIGSIGGGLPTYFSNKGARRTTAA